MAQRDVLTSRERKEKHGKTQKRKGAHTLPPHYLTFTLRLTDTQYDTVTEAAEAAGISCSSYIRQQLLHGKVIIKYNLRVDVLELQKLTSEFHRIENNLNQIAKRFHTGGLHSQEICSRINRAITDLYKLRKEVIKMAGDFHGYTEAYRK